MKSTRSCKFARTTSLSLVNETSLIESRNPIILFFDFNSFTISTHSISLSELSGENLNVLSEVFNSFVIDLISSMIYSVTSLNLVKTTKNVFS